MNRRDLLKKSLILGGAIGSVATASWTIADRRIPSNPFQLGIASGDITANSVILWTRLVTEPQALDGGMGDTAIPVAWQIAKDPSMRHIVQQGEQYAHPMLAHSIHIDVQELEPGEEYWYRFFVNGYTSKLAGTEAGVR